MSTESLFVEVHCTQRHKATEHICGDVFMTSKIGAENRIIAVLSDGLGSGVKANILSSVTATMALKFAAANRDILRASETIMDTLPVCQQRKISYATFSIVDCTLHDTTHVVEQGNPPYLLIRNGEVVDVKRRTLTTDRWRDRQLHVSEIQTQPEDRLIVFSDGVSQAGLGGGKWRLGWRVEGCAEFVKREVAANPTISARELAQKIVHEAEMKEPSQKAEDDISCAVFYFRQPRRCMVLSGPPFKQNRDSEIAFRLHDYKGQKVICGGTTANIVARELEREVYTTLPPRGATLPPISKVDGLDLVTEGILTLTRTAQYLEEKEGEFPLDPAGKLAEILVNSDQIEFLVGTRINEAHQDPSLPVDLEIRRNIIKRIAAALETKYLKETGTQYI